MIKTSSSRWDGQNLYFKLKHHDLAIILGVYFEIFGG